MIIFENGMDADVAPCNYSCAACNHFAPIAHIPYMEPFELRRDLLTLRQFVHMPRMSILGGEPTLHPQLLEILQIARESQIGDVVETTTNATRLHLMPEAFWQAFDVLYISLYEPNPQLLENYELARQKAQQYGFELKFKKFYFYKVLTREPLSEDLAQNHFDHCVLKRLCHGVYHQWFYYCPVAKILPGRMMGLDWHMDGIKLDDQLTEAKLRAYLDRPEHLASCHRCSQQQEFITWHQTKTEEQWIQASATEK